MSTFDQLSAGLRKAALELGVAMHGVFDDTAKEARDGWRDNIRSVAPRHLPHAPGAITSETRALASAIISEVGPVAGHSQANLVLGDELGSRNQVPHLSGQRAAEPAGRALDRRADAIIGHLLP